MKTSILSAAALAIVSVSTVALASPQSGLTREQVVAELKALQEVGYHSGTDHTRYPANLLAAKAELAKREQAPTQTATGVATGDAMPASASGMKSGMKRAAYGDASLHERIYRGQ